MNEGHQGGRLSQAIADGLKDPRVGFVTVTGVETSADLRHAKVFVSVLGTPAERERTLAGLRSSHGYLQERVAAAVRLKRTPQLEFVYDESIDRGHAHRSCCAATRAKCSATKRPRRSQDDAGDEPPADEPRPTTVGQEG